MQVTGAAFQAMVNLNEQATDPISLTPVTQYPILDRGGLHLANPMVDPIFHDPMFHIVVFEPRSRARYLAASPFTPTGRPVAASRSTGWSMPLEFTRKALIVPSPLFKE